MPANNSKITTTQIDELRHFIYNDIGRDKYISEIMKEFDLPSGSTLRTDRLFFKGKGECRNLILKNYKDETLSEIIRMTEAAIKRHAENPKKYLGSFWETFQKTPRFLWFMPTPIEKTDYAPDEDGHYQIIRTGEMYYPQMINTVDELQERGSYRNGHCDYKIYEHRLKIIKNALAKFKLEQERRAN